MSTTEQPNEQRTEDEIRRIVEEALAERRPRARRRTILKALLGGGATAAIVGEATAADTNTGSQTAPGGIDVNVDQLRDESGDEVADIDDTGAVVWQRELQFSNDSVTIAGNSVTLGGSTSVDHSDLSNIGSSDHHSKTSSASELTDVSADSVSDAHHAKYTDSDAVSAVESADPLSIAGVLSLSDNAADPTANGEVARNSTDVKVHSGGSVRNLSNIGSSSGAPTDAEYVTLSTDGSLSDERTLNAGDGLALTDNGANSNVDLTAQNVTSVSSAYTASEQDVVLADASGSAFSVTLPSPSTDVDVVVKKTDSSSNAVTVATPGSETIDGDSSRTITGQYNALTIVSDETNYYIV